MAKQVLKYVQKALDKIDSDQVDSINDTEESLQVASFLEDAYFELMTREEWTFNDKPATLTAAIDLSNPAKLIIGDRVHKVHYVSYNVADDGDDAEYRELCYLEPLDFIRKFGAPGDNRTLVNEGNRFSFYIRTDKQPEYFTVLDDSTILCDSYDSDYDSTLVASKVNVYANIIPEFEVRDEFEVPIPLSFEPLLQTQLNADCHAYLLKTPNAKEETKATAQLAQKRRNGAKVERKRYFKARFGRK